MGNRRGQAHFWDLRYGQLQTPVGRKMSQTPSCQRFLSGATMLALLFGLSTVVPIYAAGGALQRPNVLLAIADDWGWPHAGVYGDPVVKTAVFDRLARQGILFRNAFVASPSCTASRAALLTGQWPWRLEESANLWSTLQARFPVYPDLLEEAGYFVGFTRKGWGPGKIRPGGRKRNPAGPRFADFRQFLNKRPAGQPFCFWFGSFDPHRPYEHGRGVADGIPADRIRLPACFPDDRVIRADVADYYWEVQRFDREVGGLLSLLDETGEAANTIVIVTGDHGMPFPRCKGNLYDSGTRVPLVIRWPRRVPPGRTSDALVSLVDIAPTLLDAASLVPPAVMSGKTLTPDLVADFRGAARAKRDYVLTGKERHVPCQEAPDTGGTPMRAIRTRAYLYIRNFRPDRWPAGTPHAEQATYRGSWYGDCDNGPTKTDMIVHRASDTTHRRLFALAFAKRPAEELYDLERDPDQLTNVAADPAYAVVRRRLEEQLTASLRASGDPRIVGGGDRFDRFPYYGKSPLKPGFDPRAAGTGER